MRIMYCNIKGEEEKMANYERFDKIQMVEFNAGKMEWRDWITSSESYINVSSRIHRACDKDEKAYFIGVLYGAKSNGFNPNDPKNIKARNWKGELIKIDREPENHAKKGQGRMLIAARNRKKTKLNFSEE